MKIYLNNMVCRGTRFFVLIELERLALNFKTHVSGEIEIEKDLSMKELESLDDSLDKYGLELVLRSWRFFYGVREVFLDLEIKHSDLQECLSPLISGGNKYNTSILNRTYTQETVSPVEKYFIIKRLEKIKLIQSELSDILSITNSQIHHNDISRS